MKLTSIAADELSNGSPGGKLYLDSILAALSSRLVAVQQSCEFSPATLTGGRIALTLQQINTVRQYMRANLDRDIGLRELSASIGLSEFHFSRCFRKQTGVSPWRYFTNMRIEQAQHLLSNTSLVIP